LQKSYINYKSTKAEVLRLKAKKLLITLLLMLFIAGTIDLAHAGIAVTITEIDGVADLQGDTATYIVNVESITTEDENLQLSVIAHDDLEMSWTFTESSVATGATENFELVATYTGTAKGNLAFTVFGEAWPIGYSYEQAIDIGLLETSSYTAYVYVTYAEPEPIPSNSPTPSPTTPTPSPTSSPTTSSTPTPTPTETSTPEPTLSPSPSSTPPPEETSITVYVIIGIIGVAAIVGAALFLRRK
jgi:hypothetical protein